jgi:hypothetical protein
VWRQDEHRSEELLALSKRLEAAHGYLGLGMPLEAWNELEAVEPSLRASREVLVMRVEVCRALEKWEMMAEICRFLARHEPDEVGHVLNLAYAVRRHESPAAAAVVLEAAVPRFSAEGLIPYNLACYRALDGRIDEAKRLLPEAFALDASLRLTALDDADLSGVW